MKKIIMSNLEKVSAWQLIKKWFRYEGVCFADDDRAHLMNQQYKRSMLRKDNRKDKGKLWNANETLWTSDG